MSNPSQLLVEVLVVGAFLAVEVFENLLAEIQVFAGLLHLAEVFVDQTNVADGHSSVMVVVITVTSSKHFYGLVVVFDGIVVLLQRLVAVGEVGKCLSNFECVCWQDVLLDDERPSFAYCVPFVGLFRVMEVPLIEVDIAQ